MTESEVPTLGLGSEQRQMWTQTVMSLAYGVRQRRQALGQVAWSDEQTAQRRQERTARIADPTVRAMSTESGPRRRPAPTAPRRRAAHPERRGLGDGVDRPAQRRADRVAGHRRPRRGSTTPTATAAVSCADTPTAMKLADELLAGGPDKVDRLHAFATLSARRAAAAAHDLTEPEPDRLARTASAVRQVWAGPRYTALAEAIVASPAFPALAWRLHELEERGYAFTDVLGRIDPDRLMGRNVLDPAALAEWFVEQMAPDSAGGQPRRRRPGRRQLPGSERNTHRGARAHTAPLANRTPRRRPPSGVRHGRHGPRRGPAGRRPVLPARPLRGSTPPRRQRRTPPSSHCSPPPTRPNWCSVCRAAAPTPGCGRTCISSTSRAGPSRRRSTMFPPPALTAPATRRAICTPRCGAIAWPLRCSPPARTGPRWPTWCARRCRSRWRTRSSRARRGRSWPAASRPGPPTGCRSRARRSPAWKASCRRPVGPAVRRGRLHRLAARGDPRRCHGGGVGVGG